LKFRNSFIVLILIFVVGCTLSQSYSSSNAQLESTTANQTEFTSYNNTEFGISFDYPSNWEVSEKTNRFDTATPDVKVTSPDNPMNSFSFLNHYETSDESLASIGLKETAEGYADAFIANPGSILIEDVNNSKYTIDGNPTATFLFTDPGNMYGSDKDIGNQFFMVEYSDKLYAVGYKDTVDNFDSPQSQEIMERIISSFRFY
jgi:hypothetical protein